MKMMSKPFRLKAGFTLMEVLAAMTLLALVLPVVMKGISLATILASDSAKKTVAAELAENRLLEALLLEEWKSSSGKGDFGTEYPGYNWTMTTSQRTEAGLKQIDLAVTWKQRGYEREILLTTLVYEVQE